MKIILPLKTLILLILIAFSVSACKKGESGEDGSDGGGGSKPEKEKVARAKHNDKIVADVGNVYIAAALSTTEKQQLYAKLEYGEDDLAYYVSPVSDTDLGTDHRVVYGAPDAQQRVLEMDEERRSVRFYTQRNGNRFPLLLDVVQHGAKQYELKLFRVDWEKGSQEIIGSVYLRNGQSVGVVKQASVAGGTKLGASTSASDLGFLGCQRPTKQTTASSTVAASLNYMQCFLLPLMKDEGGFTTVLESTQESPENSQLYIDLLVELRIVVDVLDTMGKVFGSFQTDPMPANEPLKSFKWYDSKANTDKALADIQLSFLAKASALEYDETNANSRLKLVLQVQDKAKKALVGQPVFVDFRVELEQAGKVHLLWEEIRSSDRENGQVMLDYAPSGATIKPKLGDKLTVSYRLSANEDGAFEPQQVKILDRKPAKIEIVSGNAQETSWQQKLKAPLVVKVTNKAGEPLENVRLQWTVESVGYQPSKLIGTQGQTDAKGLAQSDFSVSLQREKLEKIHVKVLDKDGNAIAGLEVTFTYKLKRKNYSLVILKPLDASDYSKWEEVGEWKNGDDVMLYNEQDIMVRIKLDGKTLKYTNGQNIEIILSSKNMHKGPASKLANHPFQAQDIVIKNCPIRFSDYDSGSGVDSIVVNLTINNQLYRSVVGKTITAIGSDKPEQSGYQGNSNAGEVVTFKFKADGKVQVNSAKHAEVYNKRNSDYTVSSAAYGYAPIYSCDGSSNNMKRVIGIIHATPDAASSYNNHSLHCSFILFADGTFTAHNIGVGYNPCAFSNYWKSLKIQ